MNIKNPATASIIFAYLVIYFVWGSTFFFIERALHSFPPFVLGSIRFILAGGVLMTFCALKGYKIFHRTDVKRAAMIGFVLLFIDMAAVIWSEQYISSGIVSILSAATAIWFILFDKPKWKQNFSSVPIILGLALGFGGVFMLFGEQIFSQASNNNTSDSIIAMIVLVIGTIGWAIGSLYAKYTENSKNNKENKEEPLNVIVKTAWQMVTAGTAFTLTALLTGQYSRFQISSVASADWGAMLYLVFMGSILAFSSYIWLLQMRPATEVSTYAYINPIVALLLAHFFTDHQVTILQVSGLAVVLFSVMLMNWNLYTNARAIRALKHRKKLKRLRHMAPKSSIPRIIEVADFNESEETRKQKKNSSPDKQV